MDSSTQCHTHTHKKKKEIKVYTQSCVETGDGVPNAPYLGLREAGEKERKQEREKEWERKGENLSSKKSRIKASIGYCQMWTVLHF